MSSHPASDDPSALSVVKAIYASLARGDSAAVLDSISPDIVVRQSSALPIAGDWRGKPAFEMMAAAIHRAWPGFTVTPKMMVGEGATVLVLTQIGNAQGTFDQPMIELWRVEHGQATECRPFYFDPAAAAAVALKGE